MLSRYPSPRAIIDGSTARGGVDVRHAVHLPHALDRIVRVLEAGGGDEAGVGDEQVDRAVRLERRLDQPHDRGLVTDVDAHAGAADVGSDPLGLGRMEVGDDHVSGSGGVRRTGERLPDTRSSTGDDDDTILQFHAVTVERATCRGLRRRRWTATRPEVRGG